VILSTRLSTFKRLSIRSGRQLEGQSVTLVHPHLPDRLHIPAVQAIVELDASAYADPALAVAARKRHQSGQGQKEHVCGNRANDRGSAVSEKPPRSSRPIPWTICFIRVTTADNVKRILLRKPASITAFRLRIAGGQDPHVDRMFALKPYKASEAAFSRDCQPGRDWRKARHADQPRQRTAGVTQCRHRSIRTSLDESHTCTFDPEADSSLSMLVA
jgi:hypothetical protein